MIVEGFAIASLFAERQTPAYQVALVPDGQQCTVSSDRLEIFIAHPDTDREPAHPWYRENRE